MTIDRLAAAMDQMRWDAIALQEKLRLHGLKASNPTRKALANVVRALEEAALAYQLEGPDGPLKQALAEPKEDPHANE